MSITQSTFNSLSDIFFITIFFGFFTIPTMWLFLTLTTPKIILEKYFRRPYFTDSELEIMGSFPLSLLRTSIFAWTTVFPRLGEKRNISDIRKNTPLWYRSLITLWILVVIPSTIIIFFGVTFLLSINITK